MLTMTFNDIFINYESWKEFVDTLNLFDRNDVKNVELVNFDKYCYEILRRHFNNVEIRYMNPNDFVSELGIVYSEKFNYFYEYKKMAEKTYLLSDDDIILIGESILNNANNPNYVPGDPKNPLGYISNQNYSISKTGKLTAYMEYMKNIPMYSPYKFIFDKGENGMSFNDLFINVQIKSCTLY